MKLFFVKSKTPLLDISSLILGGVIYYFWLLDPLCALILGDSANKKIEDGSVTLFVFQIIFILSITFGILIASLFGARYMARKLFGKSTGDSLVEFDTKENKTRDL